jgi:glycosyltransferase involved in cell wall biosynthesis
MKIAIVHDWLNQKVGGAESVLFELADMYPRADIYTLVYNEKKFRQYLQARKIYKSRLQRFPRFMRKNPKLLLPFIKKAVGRWDFSGYDLVITSSSAWVKNINVPDKTRHLCYCHTPARMLWDSWPDYIDQMKIPFALRFYLVKLASKLRLWDYYQSQNNTEFIANDKYVAKRIKKFYHKPSRVIYPPVNTRDLKPASRVSKQDYYVIVSVLSKYKNIQLAIKAFIKNGKKLVIAGDGPELMELQKLSRGHDNIEFKGRVSGPEKASLLRHARGFVFCSIEDFGISMVEAISAGTPVVALRGGGAAEIIKENITGLFFDRPNVGDLNSALDKLEATFDKNKPINNSYVHSRFDQNIFITKVREVVGE